MNVELAVDARATLGEGPFWHPREGRLYWVDIEGKTIHVHDPEGQPDAVYDVGCRVGAAVPRRSGGLVLATEFGFETFDLETAAKTPIFDPEADPVDYPRARIRRVPVERRRNNFHEVELPWRESTALRESKRCLRCDVHCEP